MASNTYNPALFEDKWYRFWIEKGYFHADEKKVLRGEKPKFSVVLPPPNVTGVLHVGHALNSTLQDIICRWKRMKGFEVCWIPGTDHAGIATQWVVERELAKEGLTRHDIGREEFLERVWKWKDQYGSRIINQLKKLGTSCDWSRERFTMDEGFSKAVKKAFVTLYKEGLIYRGKRLINWCPRCHTALSDLEVEHEEEQGNLWYIKYPIVGEDDFIVVATTRPETMLGDVAVAVNPNDERYKHLVGKKVLLPIVNREIPIIADEYVDPEFGTGAVKITPAHDFNDFEVAQRHNLSAIQVMDDWGRITVSPFKGMDRFEARKAIVSMLKEEGFLEKVESHVHSVGHCYRCKTVVEPYLSDQWFVKTKPLAERAIKAVKTGEIRFVPKQWENTFFDWMYNIRDWCISRQIWWGHRIPAWYCKDCGHINVSEEVPEKCENCGSTNLYQDEDVLDTWFSSAMWPFGTLGWPKRTDDLKVFYPTDLLVTGFDIIFFWVSRMMMMGYYFMKEKPFSDVYVHALVRDEKGQKMSKTKGNVIDPLEMVEKYGADTLRFTLAALAAQGRDIRLSEKIIEGYRHFANKIWNIARFIFSALENVEMKEAVSYAPEDKWILSKLSKTVEIVDKELENYRFNDAAKAIYQFLWSEFADWYIEFSKQRVYKGTEEEKRTVLHVLLTVLRDAMKLLHPIMPFLTEEIYQKLPNKDAESIVIAPWPTSEFKFEEDEARVEIIKEVIRGIRNVKAELNISPSTLVDIFIKSEDDKLIETIEKMVASIKQLAKVSEIHSVSEASSGCVSFFLPGIEVYVKVGELINVENEISRIMKKLKDIEKDIQKLERKLSNENFLKKAPKNVVEKNRKELEELKEVSEKLARTLQQLKHLQ
ncbi:Valyl-tRNA synthetase [Desulfurobacterium thermolithotrophum DSM 11699]|uniref:Valine--tRNA ligase n=1 Tax=Desulfurobacterium thermolithotrophum (strain DSM 11699 / BSA) TaxID=868864 RepID=F0S214_DESTD|nr:valine--tRNA ligase [Desulfurobacterium thermolithotrophum]ADY74095.1 Valyl-tRNA synthetase [Desulfurobacterium thermolithotrophum DSM 11699]